MIIDYHNNCYENERIRETTNFVVDSKLF